MPLKVEVSESELRRTFNECKIFLETEYYRDEKGRTYVIGIYGERIYEDADGNMIEKTKKTRAVDINADVI